MRNDSSVGASFNPAILSDDEAVTVRRLQCFPNRVIKIDVRGPPNGTVAPEERASEQTRLTIEFRRPIGVSRRARFRCGHRGARLLAASRRGPRGFRRVVLASFARARGYTTGGTCFGRVTATGELTRRPIPEILSLRSRRASIRSSRGSPTSAALHPPDALLRSPGSPPFGV